METKEKINDTSVRADKLSVFLYVWSWTAGILHLYVALRTGKVFTFPEYLQQVDVYFASILIWQHIFKPSRSLYNFAQAGFYLTMLLRILIDLAGWLSK